MAMAAWLLGCREVEPEVTGLRLYISWPAALTVDQLAVQLSPWSPGDAIGPRELRPVRPAAPLMPPTDLVVYLADSRAGEALRVQVDGLRLGVPVATGQARGEVRLSRVSPVTMPLAAGAGTDAGGQGDGGADGDTAAPGGDRP
jgi:hypothetical protein